MSMRLWLIRKLGGYADAEEALDAVENDGERHWLLTLAVKRLYNTIGPDDILREENGKWIYRGRILDEGMIKSVIEEAKQILGMRTWQMLETDIRFLANRQMYEKSQNLIHLMTGKFWNYILDAMKTRLQSLSKGSAHFNKVEK